MPTWLRSKSPSHGSGAPDRSRPDTHMVGPGGRNRSSQRRDVSHRQANAAAGKRTSISSSNRRLRLIYLNGHDWPPSDSAVVDDFILDVRKGEGKTSLRLLGSGVPDAPDWDQSYVKIRMGWERFMARIKVTLESPPEPKKPVANRPRIRRCRGSIIDLATGAPCYARLRTQAQATGGRCSGF